MPAQDQENRSAGPIAHRDGSPERELAALALDFGAELPLDTGADIAATIAGLQLGLRSLKETEPAGMVRDPEQPSGFRFDGQATERLADALRPIGIKLNPTMSAEQVGAWIAAMVASLSDLAPRVAIRATLDAVHVPIRFFPEVEAVIREKAIAHERRYRTAIMRLESLYRKVAEAAVPKPALPDPEPLTLEQCCAAARSEIGQAGLRLALRLGHIEQAMFDAAMAQAPALEELEPLA